MKKTMDQRNIRRFHKLLARDVPLEAISKSIKVSVDTLKKFTPEKCAAAAVRNLKGRVERNEAAKDAAADTIIAAATKVQADNLDKSVRVDPIIADGSKVASTTVEAPKE